MIEDLPSSFLENVSWNLEILTEAKAFGIAPLIPCFIIYVYRLTGYPNPRSGELFPALNFLPSALLISWMTSLPLAAAMGTPKPLTHKPII